MIIRKIGRIGMTLALMATVTFSLAAPSYAACVNDKSVAVSSVKKPTISKNSELYKALTKGGFFDYEYYKDNNPDAVAKKIADDIMANPAYATDLQKVKEAARVVAYYSSLCTYESDSKIYYCSPYGVFVAGKYTCAGSTRALVRVLDFMGFSWTHSNENLYTHQWCTLYMDGKLGYADGMAELALYDVTDDSDGMNEFL